MYVSVCVCVCVSACIDSYSFLFSRMDVHNMHFIERVQVKMKMKIKKEENARARKFIEKKNLIIFRIIKRLFRTCRA